MEKSFDAANDALSIFLSCSVIVSSVAKSCRSTERQVEMLPVTTDSWAGGVAVSI